MKRTNPPRRRRLLLISYYYPPLSGSGVFRPLRLTKYLPRHGWDVTVVTVRPTVRLPRDARLVSEIPAEVRVEPTPTLEPRDLMLGLRRVGLSGVASAIQRACMLPDDQRGWVPFAVRRARQILAGQRHDAVMTTAGPYSAHLVGLALRRGGGPVWLADFRDEWSRHPHLRARYPTAWHLRRNRRMEHRVLREADTITSVSPEWLAGHHAETPEQPDGKFHLLPNGYDGEHLAGETPRPDRFRIVYTGVLYEQTSVGLLAEGLRRLIAAGRLDPADLEVQLVGHGNEGLRTNGFPSGALSLRGQSSYFDTVALCRSAAVLLLSVPPDRGAGLYTGKLYTYLAAGRPILTVADPQNGAARLVQSSGSGIVVPPDQVDAMVDGLGRLYDDWKSRRPPAGRNRAMIATFEANGQAERLAGLLEELAAPGRES